MKIEININEKEIEKIVTEAIAQRILTERTYENKEARYGIRNGMDKAVKKYIYEEKEYIIERVIDRATKEVVRKGLPKLLENLK